MQIVALLKLLFSRRGRAHQPNMAYVVTRVARRTSRRAAMISRVRTYHPTTGLAADVLDVDPLPFSIITSAECNIDVVDSLKAIDADPIPFSVFTLREYPPSLVTYVATSAHKFTDATYDDDWQQRQQQEGIVALHRRRYRWRCHRCTLEPKSPNKSLLNSDTTIHICSTLSASAVVCIRSQVCCRQTTRSGSLLFPFKNFCFKIRKLSPRCEHKPEEVANIIHKL